MSPRYSIIYQPKKLHSCSQEYCLQSKDVLIFNINTKNKMVTIFSPFCAGRGCQLNLNVI